ncbi:hypothetical protein O181_060240 [Austropuccinia psidii MF-1]|uniref:Uncharacterized protein n=1 Tax=Austropuccinia psidii MF-1 TaxID=1389203 RepID=A0A9Q3HZF4_9BASI|nr:hypothetical protein [Austropuccinia psidii MF-1]
MSGFCSGNLEMWNTNLIIDSQNHGLFFHCQCLHRSFRVHAFSLACLISCVSKAWSLCVLPQWASAWISNTEACSSLANSMPVAPDKGVNPKEDIQWLFKAYPVSITPLRGISDDMNARKPVNVCRAADRKNITNFADVKPPFHANSNLAVPSGEKLVLLLLGSGTQNYICGPNLTWSYVGANAKLLDVSKEPSVVKDLTNNIMKGHKSEPKRPSLSSFPEIGKHYFQSPGTPTAVPVFDLGPKGVLLTKKVSVSPAPLRPTRNVPWLMLEVTQGNLAKTIFRTNTRGGQAPDGKCPKAQDHIEMNYAAIVSAPKATSGVFSRISFYQ